MKAIRFIVAAALVGLCLVSCKKEEGSSTSSPFYQTYWEGSTQFTETSGAGGATYSYNLQMYFKTETMTVYQYTLTSAAGSIPGYYTTKYTVKDSKTAICTVEMEDGTTYDETATLSSDGNTLTYHTKILVDDDKSWTDIVMTKKPVPTNQ